MEIVNILGINLHKISRKKTLNKLVEFLNSDKQSYLVTPNPEIILATQKDEEFFYILNHANLSLPDGVALKFSGWLVGKNLNRVPGADITQDILKLAETEKKRVVIFNWEDGLSSDEDISKILEEKYPQLQFFIKAIKRAESEMNLGEFKPDIAFVTLGAPYQEKFIFHNLKKMPSVKVAIGVGGAFDFLTKKIKRAPKILRVLGLEWFWRLLKQPTKRAKRIYAAVFKFPLKILRWRFVLPFLYRANVSCLLYKREGDKYKILLVERKDQPGHWQLPQGGLDGIDIRTAGIKELEEEIGNSKFKVKTVLKNLHKYKFGDNINRHRGAVYHKHTGYKGQKQNLLIAEYLGEDSDIKINFWDHTAWKWVVSEALLDEVHEVRKTSTKIFLEKFINLNK